MSWFSDLVGIFGGGGGQSASAVSTASNNVNVSVNPAILNAVDLSPLASPLQNLVDAMTLGQAAEIQSARITADAVKSAAETVAAKSASSAASLQEQFGKLATWVALGTLGISVYRLLGASR